MAKEATNLVIVESPSKAKTIGKYLGPDYLVKASMGHLRDLPKSKFGIDLDHDFTPIYQPMKGKEAIIKELTQLSKGASMIYLATDPDREGEAISWHLKELLQLPDDKSCRVTFNEITQKVVRQSIADPREIDQRLVDAQQARRLLDRIVGYQLSPLWSKPAKPAVRIVTASNSAIRSFWPAGRSPSVAGFRHSRAANAPQLTRSSTAVATRTTRL